MGKKIVVSYIPPGAKEKDLNDAIKKVVEDKLKEAYHDNIKPNIDVPEPPPKRQVRKCQTCPRCGRKLVNLYFKKNCPPFWLCKACWDKEEEKKNEN